MNSEPQGFENKSRNNNKKLCSDSDKSNYKPIIKGILSPGSFIPKKNR